MAKYRFEQIAINSKEKKKPAEEDRFTYIGLEHLDTGSLNVTRFGSDVAPIGEKLVMRKGDVLFGKRRAYQKKVAIAPFDGIFSAHGMVLRPQEKVVDRKFFPLFISSDYFLDAAIKISVGSLSPTINWRDLKDLEFELPDLDTQKELAEVLWAINDTIESYKKLISVTDELVKSQFIEWFGDPAWNTLKLPISTIGQETECIVAGQCLNGSPGVLRQGEKAVLKVSAVTYGYFKEDEYKVLYDVKQVSKGICPMKGDLLFSRANTREYVGATALIDEDYPNLFLPDKLWKLVFKESIHPVFAKHFLSHPSMRKVLSEMAAGTSGSMYNISMDKLRSLKIIVPNHSAQEQFVEFARQSDKSKFAVLNCLKRNLLLILQKTEDVHSLINQSAKKYFCKSCHRENHNG